MKTLEQIIKSEALRLGFSACGISKVRYLSEEGPHLDLWLKQGYNGTMDYLANNIATSLNPAMLLENAKSIIIVLQNYYPSKIQKDKSAPVLSKYAYGKDYHVVIEKKLQQLQSFITKFVNQVKSKSFVDTSSILEKKWAIESGLGWRGKNSLLITPKGSFFFIGGLILDIELEADKPIQRDCGTCNRCIQACPTSAIVRPGMINATRCIAYLTIESKSTIPEELKNKLNNRVFGCDICQDVCPYNQKAEPTKELEFQPSDRLMDLKRDEWFSMSENLFNTLFSHSPLKRRKFTGFKNNLDILKDNHEEN